MLVLFLCRNSLPRGWFRFFVPLGAVELACILLLALYLSGTPSPGQQGPGEVTSASDVRAAPAIAPRPVDHPESLPESTTYATIPNAPTDVNESDSPNGTVVHPHRPVPVYQAPGAPPFAMLPVKQISSDTWVPVAAEENGWIQVLLPSRPNGSVGWLSTQDSSLTAARTPYRVEVNRTAFRMTLIRDTTTVAAWTVGVGKDAAPTPSGRTFVMASLADANQTYSPVILPLGIHSTSHETFGGGPGTTGIHTWPDPRVFGTRSSDGCIRVPAEALYRLAAEVPLGTPVLIH
ncbi:L,D-transpeptidase family protein [Amycolatopsis rubida]|uniref:L,D-transpeptidase family protein n=2 Tax=Pseudonocardiaceae TaxID=2070 RepID=A0ABX0C1R9_9PSEU|nr:L,D-transpeptidase [Amycolatopsis rubida]MYW96293.1 L,D-transpeptidase family protein [Amycolatopsis rubida]NEC61284.1 L,D-transpeptidase family protein [Amycolatopsis rubida]OAP24184.1 L,D-transpeptidase catalytic domain [Amycolatopsis sp. M39]